VLKRYLVLIIVLAVVVTGGYMAYRNLLPQSSSEAQGPVYSTAPVTRGDIKVVVEAFGPLHPFYWNELSAPADGTIEKVYIERGQRIEQGQIVAELRNDELTYEVTELGFDLERAQLQLAEMLNVSRDQVTRIDPNEGVRVNAPISGRITGLSVAVGSDVEEGAILGRIVDDTKVTVVSELTAGECEGLQVGDRALLSFSEFDGFVEGTVTSIDTTPIPKGTYFVYRVTIEAENDGLLRPGQETRVTLKVKGGEKVVAQPQKIDRYHRETVVRCPAEGTITTLHVKDMARVKAGDSIVSLGGEKTKRFIEKKQLDIRELEVKIAQKQEIRDKLVVRAGISGTAEWIRATPGLSVRQGEMLLTVFDSSKMNMWIQIDETDILQLKEGSTASVTVDALPGATFPAKVTSIDMMGKTEEGFAQYGVSLEVTGTEELRPGMTGNVSIFIGEAKNALLVPIEAVFDHEGEPAVEILTENGPEVVTLKLGLMNDRYAEAIEGLNEGQEVITGSTFDRLKSDKKKIDSGLDGLLPGQEKGEDGSEAPATEESKPIRSSVKRVQRVY
jgi:HlyD family secretion protein